MSIITKQGRHSWKKTLNSIFFILILDAHLQKILDIPQTHSMVFSVKVLYSCNLDGCWKAQTAYPSVALPYHLHCIVNVVFWRLVCRAGTVCVGPCGGSICRLTDILVRMEHWLVIFRTLILILFTWLLFLVPLSCLQLSLAVSQRLHYSSADIATLPSLSLGEWKSSVYEAPKVLCPPYSSYGPQSTCSSPHIQVVFPIIDYSRVSPGQDVRGTL